MTPNEHEALKILTDTPTAPAGKLWSTPPTSADGQTRRDLLNNRLPEHTREWRRIFDGVVSEYVVLPTRTRYKRIERATATGGGIVLTLNPWKLRSGGSIDVHDREDAKGRVQNLHHLQVEPWRYATGDILAVLVYDESEKLTDDNASDILYRNSLLWTMLYATWPDAEISWYNARMQREDDVFPFVHKYTPGPSMASLYHWDNATNRDSLYRTKFEHGETWGNIELHRQRKKRGGGKYDLIGHMPERFQELSSMVKPCPRVVVSEPHIVEPDTCRNLKSFVEGLA